ncbi:UNVERIFIED_CONTAM: hypothetical protein Sindi_1782400 [Sesamum indicum]
MALAPGVLGREDFHQESSKNKTNRATNPMVSSIVYCGGSSSIGMHKRKLEVELGRPLKQMELFARCYKKKEEGDWSGLRAAEMWLDAVGGKNKDGILGLGSKAHFFSRTYTSPSLPHRHRYLHDLHGGPHRPARDEDGQHDGHDEGDADQLLNCGTVT